MNGKDRPVKKRSLPRFISHLQQSLFFNPLTYTEMCLLNFNSISFQSMTPSKRALARQSESPTNLKKRKQLSKDDYVNSVSFLDTILNHCPFWPNHNQTVLT